jgi:NADP-dependent 3-hydroxy acid dehydrogenase YdfG
MSTSMIAVIGAVEELAQSSRTISLVDEIFEINFFANVNIIKAILPVMRERKNGHIIVITGISECSHPSERSC